jgi:hypothetical protein
MDEWHCVDCNRFACDCRGSGLTIYGTRISSQEDSGRLEKEIQTTLGKLEQAKREANADSNTGSSGDEAAKIQPIEDEFTAWAKNFRTTRVEELCLIQSTCGTFPFFVASLPRSPIHHLFLSLALQRSTPSRALCRLALMRGNLG